MPRPALVGTQNLIEPKLCVAVVQSGDHLALFHDVANVDQRRNKDT